MSHHAADGRGAGQAAYHDRFASWAKWPACIVLAIATILLVAAALTPIGGIVEAAAPAEQAALPAIAAERDTDLAFYDRVIERLAGGEAYYDFIVEEQRVRSYPLRPGLTVRLPTLAYIYAQLGDTGMAIAAIALLLAAVFAWWRRLASEPASKRQRVFAFAWLLLGLSLGTNMYFFVLHELWAGMLIALAFGLHRPGRWGWALVAAALALAIREHAAPFVMLMAATAAWRRDWLQAAAWAVLLIVFAAALWLHMAAIAPQVLPTDLTSPGWLVIRGLEGWLGNIVLSSNLRLLPTAVAGPLVVLAMLGWAGWRSAAGTTGTLLYFGYGAAFMLASRAENYYWGAVVAPAMFAGLAFAPMAVKSLLAAAVRTSRTPPHSPR